MKTTTVIPEKVFASCGRFSAVVLAGMLLLTGCKKGEAAEETPTVNVQVDAASIGNIQRKINADATLFPVDQAAIVPKVTAPVVKFYVDRGSKVRAGQLLAELENKDLEGATIESQGNYQQADATYQ